MRWMIPSYRLQAPFGAPFFLGLAQRLLLLAALSFAPALRAADDIERLPVAGSDFRAVHEGLIEAIEAEGLVVSAVIPFNAMLARTGGDLGQGASPYAQAEIVQFCSSLLAWQLIEEDAGQVALCPLSIAVFALRGETERVTLAWRRPGQGSPGRLKAETLLRRLAERAAELGRLRW